MLHGYPNVAFPVSFLELITPPSLPNHSFIPPLPQWPFNISAFNGQGLPIQDMSSVWSLYASFVFGWIRTLFSAEKKIRIRNFFPEATRMLFAKAKITEVLLTSMVRGWQSTTKRTPLFGGGWTCLLQTSLWGVALYIEEKWGGSSAGYFGFFSAVLTNSPIPELVDSKLREKTNEHVRSVHPR